MECRKLTIFVHKIPSRKTKQIMSWTADQPPFSSFPETEYCTVYDRCYMYNRLYSVLRHRPIPSASYPLNFQNFSRFSKFWRIFKFLTDSSTNFCVEPFSSQHLPHNIPDGWVTHNIDDRVEQCRQPVDDVGGYECLVAWEHIFFKSMAKLPYQSFSPYCEALEQL